ncbi:hypothetical protein D9619_011308 [Psilocybe cf. subviscida]|uniref:Uncharacterized protein n=1 Tax=Psilocybe cf. subviscida TaxID=2480587 RepID=A0A8H5BJ69_9AGAR|nr:hypothetical protein D9619_011308 [Psilocybe cf. subviscida]
MHSQKMKLTSALAMLACTFVTQASTVSDVLTDVNNVNTAHTLFNAQINAFPFSGGSLTAALNLAPLPVSVTDATSILNTFNNLKPVIITALTDIVAKKSGFASLPIGGFPEVIKSDLTNLSAASQAFEAALIAKTPSILLASASALTSSINAAFATAIAAYS